MKTNLIKYNMMSVYEAPNYDYTINNTRRKIFLAGTIDSGNSFNWQKSIIEEMSKNLNLDIIIYNPRRYNYGINSDIYEQINWELDHLDKCDLIVMNILDNSKSPISLMEIGLYSKSEKLIVFCSKNYYRYENIDVVCNRYNIPLYNEEINLTTILKHL